MYTIDVEVNVMKHPILCMLDYEDSSTDLFLGLPYLT